MRWGFCPVVLRVSVERRRARFTWLDLRTGGKAMEHIRRLRTQIGNPDWRCWPPLRRLNHLIWLLHQRTEDPRMVRPGPPPAATLPREGGFLVPRGRLRRIARGGRGPGGTGAALPPARGRIAAPCAGRSAHRTGTPAWSG